MEMKPDLNKSERKIKRVTETQSQTAHLDTAGPHHLVELGGDAGVSEARHLLRELRDVLDSAGGTLLVGEVALEESLVEVQGVLPSLLLGLRHLQKK